MKALAIAAMSLLATAPEWAEETKSEPVEALGVKEGEKVPKHRRRNDDHETMRWADYPGKAGFDEVGVYSLLSH